MSFIDVQNIKHSFNSLNVLNDISLRIKEGEFVSVIGPSGCGKTTLLKILGGLLPPSHGNITIKDSSLDIAIKRRDFGFVFQNPVLLPWRTVLQNIELPLEIIGDQTPFAESEKLLELLGLKGFGKYYPKALSGGMKQRVAIARALVFNPDILLMDEPFGALDELTRERLNLELLKIWEQTHKTIIFITHSISEAVFLSNRVIVLSERPAKIDEIKEIDLPFPRTIAVKQSKEYFQYITWLRNKLKKS
ncbi:MAG: ABC transporter [Candidatus Portnoybacteria bacterium CG08_land_8_20_14_0_20_40_83]|nr:MAG: ABC transporter [Candidatus Portnoybacteria bacterium CG08_land_8_20_14_0_20_40_83]